MPQTPPLQIFKPGLHTAMNGAVLQFSEADLQKTVAAYDPTKHEAPLVVGHPAHDDPAYGWVQALQFAGGALDAIPAQVNPDFAEMVASGAFKKISASFYAPNSPANPVPGIYYLRHVGFLGATAPAVKGMRAPQFAATEEGVLTFEFAEPPPITTHQEPTVIESEKAALEAENTRLRAELAAARRTAVHAANVAFCESCAGVLPDHRALAVEIADQLAAQPVPLEFGEGDQKAPLLTHFKAFLKALAAPVQFGEAATRERAAPDAGIADHDADAQFADTATPERLAQHKAVLAYMEAHKTDYKTAANAVVK